MAMWQDGRQAGQGSDGGNEASEWEDVGVGGWGCGRLEREVVGELKEGGRSRQWRWKNRWKKRGKGSGTGRSGTGGRGRGRKGKEGEGSGMWEGEPFTSWPEGQSHADRPRKSGATGPRSKRQTPAQDGEI
jgi:hypothetical protein